MPLKGDRGVKLDTFLHQPGNADGLLRAVATLGLLGWNSVEGAVFEHQYPASFVKLYPYPLWRIMVILAVYLAAAWTPDVGVMMAFGAFFYVMDMEVTLERWIET